MPQGHIPGTSVRTERMTCLAVYGNGYWIGMMKTIIMAVRIGTRQDQRRGNFVFFAAGRGSTIRSTCVHQAATGPIPATGSTPAAFAASRLRRPFALCSFENVRNRKMEYLLWLRNGNMLSIVVWGCGGPYEAYVSILQSQKNGPVRLGGAIWVLRY